MRNLLSGSFELSKEERAQENVDIELGLQGDTASSAQPGFDGFLEQVREIEKVLDTLAKLLKNLQNSNEESKVVTKAAAMKDIKKRMEKDVNEVTKVARLGKSKLQQLNKDNLANREKPGFGKGSAVDRSRTSKTNTLTTRLRERISEFQVHISSTPAHNLPAKWNINVATKYTIGLCLKMKGIYSAWYWKDKK